MRNPQLSTSFPSGQNETTDLADYNTWSVKKITIGRNCNTAQSEPGTNRKKPGITQVPKASRSWGANIPGGCTEKIAPAMNGPRFARMSIKIIPQGRGYVTSSRQLGQIKGILPTKSLKGPLFGNTTPWKKT